MKESKIVEHVVQEPLPRSNRSTHLGIHKQTNACWSIPRSQTVFIHFKVCRMFICFTVTIFLIMTCYQLHATFFGSKRCPGGNTQAPPQTVQTVHLNQGRTPFCTFCSQKINKQTNTVSRSSSSQTMLEGVCGCFMPCNLFLAGNSEVSLVLQCFTAELITYIVCECDAPECLPLAATIGPAGRSRVFFNRVRPAA